MANKPTIFISYSHKDDEWKKRLVTHLGVLQLQNALDFWTDDDIRIGDAWFQKIQDAMNTANVAILLISANFLNSRFVLQEEVRRLREREEQEGFPIFPILVRPCAWEFVPWLAKMQIRPKYGTPLSGGNDHQIDEHLTAIVKEIKAVLDRMVTTEPVSPSVKREQREVQGDFSSSPSFSSASVTVQPSSALPPAFRNNIGMDFVLIPAGEFQMGSENGSPDEKPVHLVRITQPFYIGKYPVTQAQWERIMANNPSRFKGDPDRPVENVSWDEVQVFLQQLKERDGKPYRLPTEAEWEYAARAGSTRAYCFGDDPQLLKGYAWYAGNSGNTTHLVGQLNANGWNLYDVHGNVWEWVQDRYDESYYQKSPTDNPQGPSGGDMRVLRGNSWYNGAEDLRVSDRHGFGQGDRDVGVGFRVAVLPQL